MNNLMKALTRNKLDKSKFKNIYLKQEVVHEWNFINLIRINESMKKLCLW